MDLCFALYAILLSCMWISYQKWGQRRCFGGSTSRLPPGPSGLPVVGNMLQFFRARDHGQLVPYLQSMRNYGNMTTLRMGSLTWVVLNTESVANDIINKHSHVTNERPSMPIAGDLVSYGKRIFTCRTAQNLEARKMLHHLLSPNSPLLTSSYKHWLELESSQLQLDYLRRPEYWYRHNFRFAIAIYYGIIMGVRLEKSQNDLDTYQQITMEFVSSISRSPVDFFPKLACLPNYLQFWRSKWKAMGDFHRHVHQAWWEDVRLSKEKGTLEPSFVRDVLLNPATKYRGDDQDAMYLSTSVLAAGGDNTRMILNIFAMSAICHPDAFKRARDEIDRICLGADGIHPRLPSLDDMDQMPYICAFIKELIRWRPLFPLIPPHELTEGLEYEGYKFPKGTMFLINNMGTDSKYQDADQFSPERWLDGNESNFIHGLWAFGGGRRVCVGYRITQKVLFIVISRLIFCFDYKPKGEYNSHQLNHWTLDEPFPVDICPRSQRHINIIEKTAMEKGTFDWLV